MTAILAFLIDTKFGRTVLFTGLGIIVVGICWLTFSKHYYNKGWNAAIHAVEAQNAKAVEESKKARTTVKDCINGGGNWDVVNGVCAK